MRILLVVTIGLLTLTNTGCASMAESFVDSLFDAVFDIGRDDDVELDSKVLERKGIEPNSERHKRLVAEETFHRDFQRDWQESQRETRDATEPQMPADVRL